MSKSNKLWFMLILVFLAVFNIAFFLVGGFEHKVSVWISYTFIHFAYMMVLVSPLLAKNGKSSAVFGFALFSVSIWYFCIEFLAGLSFILVALDGFKSALIAQLILAGLYVIVLLINLIANEHTTKEDLRHESENRFLKEAAKEISALMSESNDERLNKKLERVYDAIKSSPAKSQSCVASLENDITVSIPELRDSIKKDDLSTAEALAQRINLLIAERNRNLQNQN